jgi:hypothetical protein
MPSSSGGNSSRHRLSILRRRDALQDAGPAAAARRRRRALRRARAARAMVSPGGWPCGARRSVGHRLPPCRLVGSPHGGGRLRRADAPLGAERPARGASQRSLAGDVPSRSGRDSRDPVRARGGWAREMPVVLMARAASVLLCGPGSQEHAQTRLQEHHRRAGGPWTPSRQRAPQTPKLFTAQSGVCPKPSADTPISPVSAPARHRRSLGKGRRAIQRTACLAPAAGLEPATRRLTAACSTN